MSNDFRLLAKNVSDGNSSTACCYQATLVGVNGYMAPNVPEKWDKDSSIISNYEKAIVKTLNHIHVYKYHIVF